MNIESSAVASPTARLAHLACRYKWSTTPEDVRRRLLLAIRDTLACGIAGSATAFADLHRRASGDMPPGRSTLIGAASPTSAQAAAFHNATAMNAMDFDDTAAVSGHPGAPVLAAALAVAEQEGSRGTDLLEAVLTGYEIAARVAVACRPSPERYALVHGSQCFLGFGTAAAAARLLKLDAEGMERAFGIVAAFTPIPVAGKFGWDEGQLSWIKDHVNWPAEAGVRAASLAAAGLPASRTIFDGERGFWRMIASDHFNSDRLIDEERFYLRDLAFKPYPCCRWLHATVEAFARAFADAGFPSIDCIRRIAVFTTRVVAQHFGSRRPPTMIDAQFSAPHAIASLCLGIPVTDWWQDDSREAPALLSAMDKVELSEDPGMTAGFLATGRNVNRIPARVIVELDDGRAFTAFCDAPCGTPGRGPDAEARDGEILGEKHRLLFGTHLSADEIERLESAIDQLPTAPNLGALSGAIGSASRLPK